MSDIHAEALLPTLDEVREALGDRVSIEELPGRSAAQSVGDVIRAAARDSAYRHFRGRLSAGEADRPIVVSAMVLVFDSADPASRTFGEVAKAAHLKTQVDGCDVAVETVAGANGLVSYWGFLQRGPALVVLTVDTLDPQQISITDLRSLVTVMAGRLEALEAV